MADVIKHQPGIQAASIPRDERQQWQMQDDNHNQECRLFALCVPSQRQTLVSRVQHVIGPGDMVMFAPMIIPKATGSFSQAMEHKAVEEPFPRIFGKQAEKYLKQRRQQTGQDFLAC